MVPPTFHEQASALTAMLGHLVRVTCPGTSEEPLIGILREVRASLYIFPPHGRIVLLVKTSDDVDMEVEILRTETLVESLSTAVSQILHIKGV